MSTEKLQPMLWASNRIGRLAVDRVSCLSSDVKTGSSLANVAWATFESDPRTTISYHERFGLCRINRTLFLCRWVPCKNEQYRLGGFKMIFNLWWKK
eukprot:scaffold12617_cov91-Cylindrotheca_fusiformis.AAC.1